MDDFPFPKWVAWLGIVAFGMIGGAVGYVTREQQSGRKITGRSLLFQSAASGFVAVLVLLLSLEWGLSLLWAGFLSGVFGFLGVIASIGVFNRVIAMAHKLEMPSNEGKGQ